jgi:hypothetical protein
VSAAHRALTRGNWHGTTDASAHIRSPAVQQNNKISQLPFSLEDLKEWHSEAGDLLAQAAILCVANGLDVDAFMKGAWSAYMEARPGLKDHLEEIKLRNQLEELRKLGRMAEA